MQLHADTQHSHSLTTARCSCRYLPVSGIYANRKSLEIAIEERQKKPPRERPRKCAEPIQKVPTHTHIVFFPDLLFFLHFPRRFSARVEFKNTKKLFGTKIHVHVENVLQSNVYKTNEKIPCHFFPRDFFNYVFGRFSAWVVQKHNRNCRKTTKSL
jgi:hypothetical protein